MLLDILKVAIGALGANKLRTSLTMLGIIIGVAAVISLMSIGKGVQRQITDQLRSIGTNLLFIYPGAQRQGGVNLGFATRPTLTYEDALAIEQLIGEAPITAVTVEVQQGGQLVAGGLNTNVPILGVTPSYAQVRNLTLAAGEFISRSHMDAGSLVVVLGANVAKELFPDQDPIDRMVRVRNLQMRVIGVLEPKGGTGFGSQDSRVFIPLTTMARRFARGLTATGQLNVNTITVQLVDEKAETGQMAAQRIGELLRQRHRVIEDDFTILSQQDIIGTATQVLGTFTLFLGAIAGISLVVGGIGIMNIMLVSVTERTREIGIRKAVGAKRRDILIQFLVESVVVSLTGGLVGVILGILISQVLSRVQFSSGGAQQVLQTAVTPDIVILAVTVAAAVGVFFGIYPANRAARLDPIQALRWE